MRRTLASVALLSLVVGMSASAQSGDISIVDPNERTFKIALQHFASAAPASDTLARVVDEELRKALEFSGLFSVVSEQAFLESVKSPPLAGDANIHCPNWRQIGADALVQGEVERNGESVRTEFRLFDVALCAPKERGKRYTGKPDHAGRMGKVIADEIVRAFTGRPGVADTEIAFVSDRSGKKEIFVMDADGGASRAATRNGSVSSLPSWSPDGNAVVYTSYRFRYRPWLFLVARGNRSPGRILTSLNGDSQIYRGVFDPKGERLAIVMNIGGSSEIYTASSSGANMRRLTQNRAIDVGPSWSPDGSQLAFVSDRTGSPQIYLMSVDGSNQRRLTFTGSYNTAPAWSPDGRTIAYETRLGGQFDIWVIGPDGHGNAPLIEHPRSDESPSWSPDGRKLAFSSSRRGLYDVYVTDARSRATPLKVSSGGKNTAPSWGPYRR